MSNLIKSSLKCPYCGSSRGFAVYDDNENCFSCGHHKIYNHDIVIEKGTSKLEWTGHLPKDVKLSFPKKYKEYLKQYFPSAELLFSGRHSIYYSRELDRLIFGIYYNYKLKCYQARSITREPKWITCSPKYDWGKKFPFISTNTRFDKSPTVLVEDIISAIKIHALGKPVIALLGSDFNQQLLNFILKYDDNFIIWLDSDNAGKKGTEKLLTKLQYCANIKTIETQDDPKCYSNEVILDKLEECKI